MGARGTGECRAPSGLALGSEVERLPNAGVPHDLCTPFRGCADVLVLGGIVEPAGTGHVRATTTEEAELVFDVVLALDDEVTRRGIATMLQQLPVVRRVISCGITEDLPVLRRGDAIVILPWAGPRAAVERLAEEASAVGAKILVLLDNGDLDCSIGRPLGSGPHGFLWRPELTLDVLSDALVRAARGELPVPSEVVQALMTMAREQPEPPPSVPPAQLSNRERQTLELLAQGLTNKQIARRLSISENSAKRYVANILVKLNSPNRTMAVAWALKNGLIHED